MDTQKKVFVGLQYKDRNKHCKKPHFTKVVFFQIVLGNKLLVRT